MKLAYTERNCECEYNLPFLTENRIRKIYLNAPNQINIICILFSSMI